jgi:hypothetical protein
MTNFTQRLLVAIPVEQADAYNAFVKDNLDPTGGDWFRVPLNTTGNADDPPTHFWACFAATDDQASQFLDFMSDSAGLKPVTGPGKNLGLASRVSSIAQQLQDSQGITVVQSDNQGDWISPADAVKPLGLMPVSTLASVAVADPAQVVNGVPLSSPPQRLKG